MDIVFGGETSRVVGGTEDAGEDEGDEDDGHQWHSTTDTLEHRDDSDGNHVKMSKWIDFVVLNVAVVVQLESDGVDETSGEGGIGGAAWYDEDDDQLRIDLSGQRRKQTTSSRVRKLRRSEDESTVKGSEYAKRLRQLFVSLLPLPCYELCQ